MGNSIFQSIRNKLGNDSGQGSSPEELDKRFSDVSGVFPEGSSISPAKEIDPERCYHVVLANGDEFLAWAAANELSGVTEEDKKEFFPDSKNIKELRHPSILTPLYIKTQGDHTIVVTEYFGGSSLLNKIDEQTFAQKAVMTIFFQVASTFHTAHGQNIIHRAINPANILVDDELNVRVFGFGLANLFFDHWVELLRRKKRRRVDYFAPEVLTDGLSKAAPHCDGFSIARVVYELLTGVLPKNNFVTLPSNLSKVPAYMDDALLNAMHSDPSKRPQTLAKLHKQFAGLHSRNADDLSKSTRRLSTPEMLAGFFQQYFKWVNSDWFKVAIVLVFFSLVGLGIYVYERIQQLPIMASLENYPTGDLISQWDALSTEELKNFYEQDKEKFNDMVVSTHQVLVKSEKYSDAEVFVDRITSARPPNIKLHAPNPIPRRANDSSSIRLIEKPHVSNETPDNASIISAALGKLKAKNPAQTEWHYHLLVTKQRTILDLSGHRNLRDISPLNGLVIHELDLSDTGVEGLFDLIGMPLDELRLCRTKVTDLDPIIGLPLGVLTFIDAPIKNIAATRHIPTLTCIIGQDSDGSPINDIKPPIADQKTWINDRGLKFRALPGIAAMLAVNEFPATDGVGPMTSISFKEAQNLCSHMTVRERKERKITYQHQYRLPTDGEWSYAALLPESRFLSPKGRLLQRVDDNDFQTYQKAIIDLEIKEGSEEYERFHNGFWSLTNHIGEWVEQSHGHWDGTHVVRGLDIGGTKLQNLRYRSEVSSTMISPAIGFRPLLEIESSKNNLGGFDETDPEDLGGKSLDTWDAPHLKAAASSSFVLNSLIKTPAYRETYISNQYQDRDPFENRLYLRVDVPMTWAKAKAIAQQLGGRLATVTSLEHLDWINQKYVASKPLGTPLWIGASALPEETNWEWVNQKSVPAELQPNTVDADKRRGALLSAQIAGAAPLTATPVGEKHAFLIEWDSPK